MRGEKQRELMHAMHENVNRYRTQVEFYKGGEMIQMVHLHAVLPNVVVGQPITCQTTNLEKSFTGTVTEISHTVFVGDEPPITYIDVVVPT